MSNTSVLYITYDGITDHIGQSQVAPYLIGLAAKGHRIALLSAEKTERTEIIEKYKKLFATAGVEWYYVAYHKEPPVLSTVMDLRKMQGMAKRIIVKNKVTIVHCRSYVASLIGLHFKKKYGTRFIFDMRDFWPDAAKEINRFNIKKNIFHRLVYKYFKRKEKDYLEESDHIVSLTTAGKRVIEKWKINGYLQKLPKISVIPCCADFSVFNFNRIDSSRLNELRSALGINENEFVISYLGSLGPSYLTNEMMDVFKILLSLKPNAKFLIIANNDHQIARKASIEKGIHLDKIIIVSAKREEVPYYVSLSTISLFFIIPSFAKQACSPTKLAELLAMNIPVISNTRVGDLDELLNLEINCSAVIKDFNEEEYKRVLKLVIEAKETSNVSIRNNSKMLSLEEGVRKYNDIYSSFA